MRYMVARAQKEQQETIYRIFVTESLRLQGEGKYLTRSLMDLYHPKPEDNRTGDEIAADIINRLKGGK